jgi:hypothetical protein
MIRKTKIAMGVATATLTLAGALVSPQVAAQSQADKTAALQTQVNEMADMMKSMQAELSRVKATASDADTAKVQELDQWMASVKSAPARAVTKDHQFSVRGGWAHSNDNRGAAGSGGALGTGLGDDVLTTPTDQDAFYYGGGIDFNINNDLFGFMDGVSFQIEFGVEYAELSEKERSGLTPAITTLDAATTDSTGANVGTLVPAGNYQQTVTVNRLRINASPKLRFMHGSKLRPWIIPLGLDINIISPPSDAVTVLNTGMQFGAGADYELLPGIVLGVDGRYHWTPDDIDGVDTDGFTLGGSVGFRF